jgi:hypothetical protein
LERNEDNPTVQDHKAFFFWQVHNATDKKDLSETYCGRVNEGATNDWENNNRSSTQKEIKNDDNSAFQSDEQKRDDDKSSREQHLAICFYDEKDIALSRWLSGNTNEPSPKEWGRTPPRRQS